MQKTDKPIVVEIDPIKDIEEEEAHNTAYLQHMATKPWLFQPGNRVNPAGRPKGKTMKEWFRDYLAGLSDSERLEYFAGIPKEVLWRMAEGNPTEDKNIKITVPQPILGGITQHNTEDIGDNTQPS